MSNTLPAHLRGLSTHLQSDEQIHLTIPGIWVTGHVSQQNEQQERLVEPSRSTTCEIILTNQRLLGYVHIRFPRERLFLEFFPLQTIISVSLRQKSFEPLFHELLVSDGQRRAYIRSSRQRIEQLYDALHPTKEQTNLDATTNGSTENEGTLETTEAQLAQDDSGTSPQSTTVYGRQDIRRTFDQSPLGITILFIGGLLLEIIGVFLWATTHSIEIGLPLCIAGFACVITATTQRRRHRL